MSDIYKIGVQLALQSNATQFFSALAGQVLHAEGLVKKLEKSFGGMNRTMLAVGGGAMVAGGVAILGTYKKLADHGEALLDQQNQMVRLGRSQNEVLKTTSTYYDQIAKAVPTASAVEYLKTVRELRAVTGDWASAEKLAPQALKTDALLANIAGTKGSSSYAEYYKLLRSAEMKGISTNPEKLAEYTDTVFSLIQGFGGKLSANDFQTLARRGGSAFIHTDIKKALGAVGVMSADLGGPTAGNALMSLYALQQGSAVLSKQQYATLNAAGLIDPRRVVQQGFGKVQVKPGGIRGSMEHEGDLPGWAQEVLRPHLLALAAAQAKKEHHPEQAGAFYEALMAKIIPNRKAAQAAMMFSDPGFVEQRLKDLGLAGEGMKIGPAYKSFMQNDPAAIKEGFNKQYDSMMSAIGAPLMQAAIPVMKSVTTMFTDIGAWANKNPETVKKIGEGFAFLGAALIATGGLAIMAAIGAGGWLVIGIGALAGAFKAFAPKQFEEWLSGFKTLLKGIASFDWKLIVAGVTKEFSAAFHLLPDQLEGAIRYAIAKIGEYLKTAIQSLGNLLGPQLKPAVPTQPGANLGDYQEQAYRGTGIDGGLLRNISFGGGSSANDNRPAGIINNGTLNIVMGGAGSFANDNSGGGLIRASYGGGSGGGSGFNDTSGGGGDRYGGYSGGAAAGGGKGRGNFSGAEMSRAQHAMGILTKIGWTPEAAASLVSQGMEESNLTPNGPSGDHGTAHGMFQWRFERFAALKTFAAKLGTPWTNFDTQVLFAAHEAKMKGLGAWAGTHSLYQGGRYGKAFEGYGTNTFGDRLRNSETVLRAYRQGGPVAVGPPPVAKQDHHHHLKIELDGKQLEARVTTRQADRGRHPTSVGSINSRGTYASPGTPLNDVA